MGQSIHTFVSRLPITARCHYLSSQSLGEVRKKQFATLRRTAIVPIVSTHMPHSRIRNSDRLRPNPVHPKPTLPRSAVEHRPGKDAPLLCLPAGVEPKRLPDQTEYAGPPRQSRPALLRQPGGKRAQDWDSDLIDGNVGMVLDGCTLNAG